MRDFCVECRKEVDYSVNKSVCKKIIKGYEFEYEKEEALCNECKNLIFVDQIHDKNIERAKIAFNKKVSEDTISLVNEIMLKYNIGKRPLALLLDWGELTITRYLDGMIPKKEYLDVLKSINEDSDEFYKILQKNHDKITRIAYEKCTNKLEEIGLKDTLIDMNTKDKIFRVADYILFLSDDITPLALQKLLYYSQSFFKVFYGYQLFENDCEAWVHGPVYPEVYVKFKEYKYNQIDSLSGEFVCTLDKEEQFFIEFIVKYFGCYSGKVLERMTHCEKPWRQTREGIPDDQKCRKIIEKSVIESYFSEVYEKYNMLSIADITDYSSTLFNRVL